MPQKITPELLLHAYAAGIFPMAESRDAEDIDWYDPPQRGILPIQHFHVPRSLRKTLRRQRFTVTFDRAFEDVVRGCAEARESTWINDDIIRLYTDVHRLGFAHSAETWDRDRLVGGTYGIALGGAFFGESMFSTETDASKVALVHLTARLWKRGFTLFDTQFVNPHLLQFGCVEIPRAEYRRRLAAALEQQVSFKDYSEASVSTKFSLEESSVFSSPCLAGLSEPGFSSDFSGALSGTVSAENFSGFSEVEAFLHSISQTS
jgi:leucyl/phenylalanyl-tRNA--protein transferase